ncbi:hypothetical protein GVAV_001039 [Gurleya vavrai]
MKNSLQNYNNPFAFLEFVKRTCPIDHQILIAHIRLSSLIYDIIIILKKNIFFIIFLACRSLKKFSLSYDIDESSFQINGRIKKKQSLITKLTNNTKIHNIFSMFVSCDDVIFCLNEIRKKKKNIFNNLQKIISNLIHIILTTLKILSKFNFFLFFCVISIINHTNINKILHIIVLIASNYFLINIFEYNIFQVLRMFKKVDDVFLCLVKISRIIKNLSKIPFKCIKSNKIDANIVCQDLMICTKIFKILLECSVFISKTLRLTAEITTDFGNNYENFYVKLDKQF